MQLTIFTRSPTFFGYYKQITDCIFLYFESISLIKQASKCNKATKKQFALGQKFKKAIILQNIQVTISIKLIPRRVAIVVNICTKAGFLCLTKRSYRKLWRLYALF